MIYGAKVRSATSMQFKIVFIDAPANCRPELIINYAEAFNPGSVVTEVFVKAENVTLVDFKTKKRMQ